MATAGAVPGISLAQARPDAGRTLDSVRIPSQSPPDPTAAAALPPQEERPALDVPGGQLIPVKRWKITGNHAFAAAELLGLINGRAGRDLTFNELSATAALVTGWYRQHGYLLSRAYLPAQEIHDGEVEIAVIEGQLVGVQVANTSRVSSRLIDQRVERLKRSGPLQGQLLERSLLLLNDLPGVEVRSTLRPGASVGTSDLDLRVAGERRVNGSFDADSYGNRYTGALRGGGTLNVNSPFHRGDLFTVRASTSGSGMRYGRAAWQTPLGGNGVQAGIAWSDLRYELGKDFESLEADGTARVGTAWVGYPLLRSQTRNASLRLGYDDKRLVDRIDATSTVTRRSLDVWTLGFSGDRMDAWGGGGFNTFQLDLTRGRLDLDPQAAALDRGFGGHRTEGGYTRLAYSFSRLQRLSPRFSLYASLSGQVSNRNLDSAEMQTVGGVYAVRAYPQGEATGADAAVLNLELRWSLPLLPEVQALAFADAGTVRVNHLPLATDKDNHRTIAGEGLGAQWNHGDRFAAKAYVAWRSGPEPTSDVDRRPRFWVQLAQYF